MIAYLDSSVVLRVVLGQPGRIPEWKRITTGVASTLVEVECLRTIDRLRLAGELSVEETAVRRETIYRVLERLDLVELTGAVLHRASQPMSAPLGTLDAPGATAGVDDGAGEASAEARRARWVDHVRTPGLRPS